MSACMRSWSAVAVACDDEDRQPDGVDDGVEAGVGDERRLRRRRWIRRLGH
jgi:hypothetical protein